MAFIALLRTMNSLQTKAKRTEMRPKTRRNEAFRGDFEGRHTFSEPLGCTIPRHQTLSTVETPKRMKSTPPVSFTTRSETSTLKA